jgi:2,5-diketo-D-gluconate reductase A
VTTTVPAIRLNSGGSIPQLGLGTWPLTDETVQPVLLDAFEAGYRHVDTAVRYGNEKGVGQALATAGLPRDEVFVTTKLDGAFQGEDRAVAGLDDSLRRLGLDHVDLLLIHWPLPDREQYVSTWRTFERLQRDGKATAIGVSNFKPAHLQRLAAETGVVPAVDQVQLSPYTAQLAVRGYAVDHGIVVESYSPLGRGGALLDSQAVGAAAFEHGRSPAQIVLRWHIQHGLVAIPKSADPVRLRQNLAVFDFVLDAEEMAALDALDGSAGPATDSDVVGH